MLGMDHPWDHSRGNQGNAENPDSKDTYIYMLVSTHSSVIESKQFLRLPLCAQPNSNTMHMGYT